MKTERNKWASRPSLYYHADTILDTKKDVGFDYHGKLMKKSVSSLFYENPVREYILNVYDTLLCEVIDKIKLIKKFRNYAIHKNDIKFN